MAEEISNNTNGSPERVAYDLMDLIFRSTEYPTTKQEILTTYQQCIKTVRRGDRDGFNAQAMLSK